MLILIYYSIELDLRFRFSNFRDPFSTLLLTTSVINSYSHRTRIRTIQTLKTQEQ
jgi:hypothetical protein